MGPLLASDPTLATNVAEESLRFEAAVQMDPARIASQDIEIGGHTFRQGERLLLLYGAGNRDPQQYENPDVFDIRRPNIRLLTLGGGIHVCLGAVLARHVALERLIARLPGLELDEPEPRWRRSLQLHELETLPTHW